MTILTTPDKEKVKRAVPKASNKIIDATVARLYIAHPDPNQWTYTGLVGAIALVDDLVGHTFFLKLVDIIGSRGVLWDQELYVDFDYHQDRKFFHTFEIEDCLVGLLFEDTSDAAHFYKRVTNRKKYASKDTAKNKNAIALKGQLAPETSKIGPRGEFINVQTDQRSRRAKGVLYYDDQPPPEWRLLYAELASAGITEDMIAENREFIKDYISKQGGPLVGLEPPIPRKFAHPSNVFGDHAQASSPPAAPAAPPKKTKKAPPPPPPAAAALPAAPTPELTPSTTNQSSLDLTPTQSSESLPAPPSAHSDIHNRFRVPPATAPVPQVAHHVPPPLPSDSQRPLPGIPQQAPVQAPTQAPTQQRPPMAEGRTSLYGQLPATGIQPPPLPPGRQNSASGSSGMPQARANPPPPPARGNPPAPPQRGPVPPPPPPRANNTGNSGNPGAVAPQRTGAPPPPPPRSARGAPPPPPARGRAPAQIPAQQTQQPQQAYQQPQQQQQTYQPPPSTYQPPQAQPQQAYQPPPPPQRTEAPAIPTQAPPTQAPQSLAPPPPPLPPTQPQASSGAPPPPPPPPDLGSAPSAALPAVDAGRDALLSSIRGAGGIGALKKTDKSQLEKPSALLSEAKGEKPPPSSGGTGQPESLADALAGALSQRKNKVAASDDEDDEEW